MRLIVDDLPKIPKECLFGWKHLEYSKWRCKFGGECELSAECKQCSHLVTFTTDTNVGIKHESYQEVTENIEPLDDKEQRIFLAAMERERKICKEVDDQYIHEPYEVLLTKVCSEIERKVKKVLWN